MVRVAIMIAAIPVLASGCMTGQMLERGWAVQTSAALEAVRDPQYHAPVATKNTNGDLIFEYDALQHHLSSSGNQIDDPPPRRLRITNTVCSAALQPITNTAFLSKDANFPIAANVAAFATNGQNLPVAKVRLSKSANWMYPGQECVFQRGPWYWYVPPRTEGDVPKVALLSTTTERTPPQQYVWRVLMVPFYAAGDIIVDPLVFLLLASGGGDL
jgi:hypothetical protein